MNQDAVINDLIRLKETPCAPVERWQTVTTIRHSKSLADLHKPAAVPSSPLKRIPSNIQNFKTPEPDRNCRLVVKAKTPKTKTKTPKNRTPGLHKTPKSTQATPAHTPSNSRFIPNRVTTDVEYSSFLLRQKEGEAQANSEDGKENGNMESPDREEYKQTLVNAFSKSRGQQQKGVLSFKPTTPSASTSYLDYTESEITPSCQQSSSKSTHHFPSVPEKILDAQYLMDDYYLNILDWGRNNILAVGLGSNVYLWNATTSSCSLLTELKEDQYVSSLAWSGNSKYLAVGDSNACIQLWDVNKEKKIRTMKGHSDRVGALAWNKHTVTSASRDGLILHNDVRRPDHVVARSAHHQMEVCGMKWAPDGTKLASGANDNLVCVWSTDNLSQPVHSLQGHKAAVKALAWCPWQPNMLATGGGTKDKTIRFWNVFTGQCTEMVDAKSQVSALGWNKYHKQLISAHGYPRNQMTIWQYPNMTKLGTLSGHSERILHMCLSPGKSRVASAASDETLRIWKCFERMKLDTSQSFHELSASALLHSLS